MRVWSGRGLLFGALLIGVLLIESSCDSTGTRPAVPPAPSGLKATTGDGLVTLRWTAVEEADEYNVYRSTRPIEELPAEPTAGVSKPDFSDESVKNGTTYYYRVTAVADEEGAPSEEVEVTPFARPPRPDVTKRVAKRIRDER